MPDSTLTTLLAVYAALVGFNLCVSLVLWVSRKNALYSTLCVVWVGALFGFVVQGATSSGTEAWMALGGVSMVAVGVPAAHLLCIVLEIPTPWRTWGFLFATGSVLSLAAWLGGAGFTWITLPVVWGSMLSGIHASVLGIRRWSSLPSTLRALVVMIFVQCLHGMDYPFFRLREEFAVGGFTIALAALLGVSILAPAVIIEKIAAQNLATVSMMKNSFARFVPTELLEHLGRQSIVDVQIGDSVKREMTILFADMRAFTTRSERMSPEQTFDLLNSYLSRMEPVIKRHGGFIDKYLGDGILAVFPHSSDDAVEAALEMQQVLRSAPHGAGPDEGPIDVGIGIHAGAVMLGTIGGAERMEGTVVGDTVNVASRIEALTSKYQVEILVSEQARARLTRTSHLVSRAVDRVQVKGRSEPISLFAVSPGEEPIHASPART